MQTVSSAVAERDGTGPDRPGPERTGWGLEPVRLQSVWGPLWSRACGGTGDLGGLRALVLGQN